MRADDDFRAMQGGPTAVRIETFDDQAVRPLFDPHRALIRLEPRDAELARHRFMVDLQMVGRTAPDTHGKFSKDIRSLLLILQRDLNMQLLHGHPPISKAPPYPESDR